MVNEKMKELLHPRKRFEAILLEKQLLTPTVCRFVFQIPDDCQDFCCTSGQYLSLQARIGEKMLARSYSLAAAYKGDQKIEFCVKRIKNGLFSSYLFDLPLGQAVKMTGPMGHFVVPDAVVKKPIVFVATGTGIAPLKAMIESLVAVDNLSIPRIALFFGVRYVSEILYEEQWKALNDRFAERFFYAMTVSRPETTQHCYNIGRVDDLLKKNRKMLDGAVFFICGLTPMIESVSNWLISTGVAECDIFYEKYD